MEAQIRKTEKGWILFKRELAKGTNSIGVPGHSENERKHSLEDEIGMNHSLEDTPGSLFH